MPAPHCGQKLAFSILWQPAGYLRSGQLRVRTYVNWYSRISWGLWGAPCMAPHCNGSTMRLRFGGLFEGSAGDSYRSQDRRPYSNGSQCSRQKSCLSITWVPDRQRSTLGFGRLTRDKTQQLWGFYSPAGKSVSKMVMKARCCSLWDSSPAWEDEAGSLPSAHSPSYRTETAGVAAPGYMSLLSCSKNCYICTCNC